MKKFIIAFLLIALVGVSGFFGFKYRAEVAKYVHMASSYNVLQEQLAAIGELTSGYTLKEGISVGSGDLINVNDLIPVSVPSAAGNVYVTDLSSVAGMCYKIPLTPGTPLTTDMLMDTPIDSTSRDYDILFCRRPVGLAVGDYVDYCIAMPDGNVHVVFSKARVYSLGTNTIKVHLNLNEYYCAWSALIDYALYKERGATLYLTKYLEPGIQDAAAVTYAVRNEIQTLMFTDANFVDKGIVSSYTALRSTIDTSLGGAILKGSEEYDKAMASAAEDMVSKITADYSTYYVESSDTSTQQQQGAPMSAWDALQQGAAQAKESEDDGGDGADKQDKSEKGEE